MAWRKLSMKQAKTGLTEPKGWVAHLDSVSGVVLSVECSDPSTSVKIFIKIV